MPDARTLPIPAAHREFTVKVAGQAVSRAHQLLSVSIVKEVNRVASARLAYLDGAPAASDFPLSNSATFLPGREVEILAGASNDQVSLFKGIIVRQSIRVRDHAAAHLILDCRHPAYKLTLGRKNACFFKKTDSDIVSEILQAAHVDGEIESTSVQHAQVVQFRATDWDFLLTRAEANGKLVFAHAAKVALKAPSAQGSSVATLLFGATILELDAQIDARVQWNGVKSVTWDPAQQTLLERHAADPGFTGPGNLKTGDLAPLTSDYELRHSAIADDEAQAWADSAWLKSRLSKVSGRAKCEGIATINPGDVVTLSGVGTRYSGDVFVTGVRHDTDPAHGWKTHIHFGSVEKWFGDSAEVSAPEASALLPGVRGLQIGVVTSNEDAEGHEDRVRVRLPLVDAENDGVWARVANLDAGKDRGFFFRPELGDEVVVGFLDDDPRSAILLGMLHSSAKPAPLKGANANHKKLLQTRSKMKISFDDDKTLLKLETPSGNLLSLDEGNKKVTLADQNGNRVELSSSGIVIQSPKAIKLKAGTALDLESGTALSAKGGTALKVSGASSAELSSSAVTQVKGSLVKIN